MQYGQQVYPTLDPTTPASVDPSHMGDQDLIGYPNNSFYDSATTSAYGGCPAHYAQDIDLVVASATYGSNSTQSCGCDLFTTHAPQSSHRMLDILMILLLFHNSVYSPTIFGNLNSSIASPTGLVPNTASSPTCSRDAEDPANGARTPLQRHSHQVHLRILWSRVHEAS
jgi:hypothetical protein